MIVLKTEQEIGSMRDAGRIVGQTLAVIKKAISPGITTQELDHIAEQFIRRAGGVPAFKGYCGFPAASVHRSTNRSYMVSPDRVN